MKKVTYLLGFILGAAVPLAGMVGLPVMSAQAQQIVKIDGSSTVYPVTEAVAEEFQKSKRGTIKVTVGISGTGGGFKKFCRGETDISDASRPIVAKEIEDCKQAGIQYIELPIAFDALTVVINPKNGWASAMTVADLKKIWEPGAQRTVMNWNQVKSSWPNAPLKLFGPGADSGTFEYFTEAIVGKAKSSRGDFTASEDDNVLVQGVSTDTNGLGYFGFAYYAENTKRLKAVSIDNGKGPVAPSANAVEDGSYQPLSRPIFIYVNRKSADKPEVKEFVEFYLKNVTQLVRQVKYVPLPSSVYSQGLQRFQKGQVGTVFGGKPEVGVAVEDLMRRQLK
jgi:phosphate transport system substrate-binding protein